MSEHAFSIRPAAVAGTFYPGEPARLRAAVGECLAGAGDAQAPARPPKILIVPHAGYAYSGPVAGRAYAQLRGARGRVRRVVLVGPAHRVAVRGLALPSADAFSTPLGPVPVDRAAVQAACRLPQVSIDDRAHAWEHSLEVQLPFLQEVLDGFAIVPVAAGRADAREVAQLLEALWGGDETLILISSDLSHFLPYEAASAVDAGTVQSILALEPLLDGERACGAAAVNGALLCAARHGLAPRLLDLRNSGDTAGSRDRVVGYCSIAFDESDADER